MLRRTEMGFACAQPILRVLLLREVAMLALSNKWAPILVAQPETGMGYQIASIYLMDGRTFDHVTIVGGFVTRVGDSTHVPFEDAEIERIVVTHGK
jgi:hypothetical protein